MKTNYKIKGIKRLLTIAILSLLRINSINAQCNANFTYTVGAAGNVNFTSTSTGTGAGTWYYWNFGDGTAYNALANPLASHTYSSNGTFNAYLMIQDTIGSCFDTISKSIIINNAACLGSASFSYSTGLSGTIYFYSTSTGVSPNSTYQWAFGDGTNANTGTNPSATHTYTAGTFNATLTVTDPLSICIFTVTQPVNVTILTCSLSANFTYTTGANGLVNFTSTSTGTNANTYYLWYFGDGSYGSGAVTSHTYTTNNLFNAKLVIYDTVFFNCYDSIVKAINITNAPCIANANFTIAKDTSMAFTWDAFPVFPVNIASATWSWGDGSSTVGLYPSHTYSAAGFYNICLTVSLTCGATNSMCINSNIYKMTGANAVIYLNVINQLAAGINTLNKDEKGSVTLYPNPNNGEFKLSMNGIKSNSNEIEINVYNLLGEVVYTTKHELINGSLSANMHMNEIPNGAYFIKAVTAGKTYTVKAIINR